MKKTVWAGLICLLLILTACTPETSQENQQTSSQTEEKTQEQSDASDSSVQEGQAQAIEEYRDAVSCITIEYPDDWVKGQTGGVVGFSPEEVASDYSTYLFLATDAAEDSADTPLDGVVDRLVESGCLQDDLSTWMRVSDAEIQVDSQEKTDLNGMDAIRFSGTAKTDDQEYRIYGYGYTAGLHNYPSAIYLVNTTQALEDTYKPEFEEIAQSLVYENPLA